MDDHDSPPEQTPEWDPDYYAERVARYIEREPEYETKPVPRSAIAQFVREELDPDYLNETINAALAQDLIEEVGEDQYRLVD